MNLEMTCCRTRTNEFQQCRFSIDALCQIFGSLMGHEGLGFGIAPIG